MPFLRKKIKKGKPYWYVVKKIRIGKTVKDEWEVYLGTVENILKKFRGVGPIENIKLKSYQFGKLAALLAIDEDLGFTQIVDELTNKNQIKGLSVGEYLLVTIFGRWCGPLSKKATAEHFDKSFLKFYYNIPHKMNAQNILNHMKYIKDKEKINAISDEISKRLILKGIIPTILNLDNTNFSTNIEKGGYLLKKGNSKDKRFDRNIVGLGLVVNEDNIPFIHETFPGNKHDSKILPDIVDRIVARLKTLKIDPESITLVMDKGNNSEDNVGKITDKMHIVGSLKRDQVRDLLEIPLHEFEHLYTNEKEHEIRGYRIKLNVFGQEYTVVVSYNPATEKRQKITYVKAKQKFLGGMKKLKEKYKRTEGRGRKMGQAGVIQNASKLIPKNFQSVFLYEINPKPKELRYWVDEKKESELYLAFGKNTIFTDLHNWSSEQIVKTYNSKYLLENDFKWLKDKLLIPVTPIYVWTDESIRVHVFLCVVGLLFMRYFLWKMKDLGVSDKELLEALENIRVALVSNQENMKKPKMMVEEMDAIQSRIFSRFDMGRYL
ncbi:MAG: IS1634 family transposase [Flavobacteriaceae bacterium]|nr:IS1634 family transposase [Flavobacteriaceae bacterium]